MTNEIASDLVELDHAIAAATEQINLLSRPESTGPGGVPVEAFVTLKSTLTEFRQKIVLLNSEIVRQRKVVHSVQASLSWKLGVLGRNATRALRRTVTRVLTPSGRRAIRRLMRGFPGGSPPLRGARDIGTRAQQGTARANSPELPFSLSEPAKANVSLNRATIVEQAFHQMREPLGLDAWDGYVYRAADFVDAEKLNVKAIAFYSPRFYRIPEEDASQRNDGNPWTIICEALPRYLGHYQPRFPGELGFYDQRLSDVLGQQVELARQYGIYGFCFEYYWSDGRPLLSQPINLFLSNPSLNLRFCVCWMNWSEPQPKGDPVPKGIETESCSDEASVMKSLELILSDPRYLRVDGKPVLIVRAPGALPNVRGTVKRWRQHVVKMGFPDVYLVGWVGDKEPADFNFDAALEFPPDDFTVNEVTAECSLIDPDFEGNVYSYRNYLEKHGLQEQRPFVNFNAVMTSWDDEPLRPGAGRSFAGATPALFARWLDCCCRLAMFRRPQERLLFIHAWNNWAEGAYLEPDRKLGYAYLQASANTLRRYRDVGESRNLIERINGAFVPRSRVAIIFHCHYDDLIAPIFERYLSGVRGADLFVTVHPDISSTAVELMRRLFPAIYFLSEENRGRDIRPFLLALRRIRSLGYVTACKLHTKKTPQLDRGIGESWRQRLMESLLGSEESVARAVEVLSTQSDIGILAPSRSVMDLSLPMYHRPNRFWLDQLLKRMGRSDLIGNYGFSFPAGSMYWFRVEALAGLDDLILAEDAFEEELGQRDGTLAHAAERLVGVYAQGRGFCIREISESL